MLYEMEDIETFYNMVNHEDLSPVLQKMKRFDIKVKGLYQGTPKGKTVQSSRYFLPPDIPRFKTSITMYRNKIVFHTFEGKINTIVIESQSLANTLRVLFELGFKAAELQHFQKD